MFVAIFRPSWYLPFVHRYSPKTPQSLEGRKWHAPSATRTSKPAPPACDFRSVPSPTGAASKRALRSATAAAPRAARGSRDGGRQAGGYAEHRIGTTDDLQDADGVAVLDYGQAQKAARAWWRAELRREEGHDTRTGPFTVADAIADYLKAFERRGGKSVYDTAKGRRDHILPALGHRRSPS